MLTLTFASVLASAQQQFQVVPGAIPGPVVWSEGVEAFDANGDGWMDILFTNGVGFNSPQGALAPTLLINQATPGSATFIDETALRMPPGFIQQGKGLTTADIDGDGDQDIIFANAFLTQPRILINNGIGIFTDETAARFPTVNLGSFGVAAGDLDNDGDLDLVFSNVGASMAPPGALPRLFINDGAGVFTDSPAKMNGVNKVGAMQVNMVDIDNDWDLDVIIDGKSAGQHLYFNDGDANFTFDGDVLPDGSALVYETDWADLDNDNDVDGFYLSLSGFIEGTSRNNLETGILSMTGANATINGTNGNDDNEIVFLDCDNDGDLDVIVGSLSGVREKLYMNVGTLTNNSLVYQPNGFTTLGDSTLDIDVADFDQDGDYDVVTAQGESGNFLNRYYENTGAPDTLGPRIGRIESPFSIEASEVAANGLSIRAWLQDATSNNGRAFVTATLTATAMKDGIVENFQLPMNAMGGGIYGTRIHPDASNGLVGMDVTYTVEATDVMGNTTTSPTGFIRVCGTENYGPNTGANGLAITGTQPSIGLPMVISVGPGLASVPGAIGTSLFTDDFSVLGGSGLLMRPLVALLTANSDSSGMASLVIDIPPIPVIEGVRAYFQGVLADPSQPLGWRLSTGLSMRICGYAGPAPTITGLSPSSAVPGTNVTINGVDFEPGAIISVGGSSATVNSITANQINFTVPAGTGCDETVNVFNPDGQFDSVGLNPAPVINNVLFGTGPVAGGVAFVVVGQNFVPGMAATFDGVPATFNNQTSSALFINTPPANGPGAVNVVITSPLGCSVSTMYTYQ